MNRFQNMREKAEITQEELSKKLGIDRSTVAKWETGKSFPRPDMLVKLARVLGCTPNDILGFEEEKTEEGAAEASERDVPACAEAAESPEEPSAEGGKVSGAEGEAERIAMKIGAAVSDSRAEARRRKEEAFARAGLSGAAG